MAAAVFDVVSEDPEEEHVACEVGPSSVEKDAGYEGGEALAVGDESGDGAVVE